MTFAETEAINSLIDKIYNDFKNNTCDNCKHRIFHNFDKYLNVSIDKCIIRELHFNGSCDGRTCDKWVLK